MINPNLINMDQGFGLRARSMRTSLIYPFTTVYKLKTLAEGAIVREYPKGYSVWMDDVSCPGGYKLLQSYLNEPPNDTVNELFDSNVPSSSNSEDERGNGSLKAVGTLFKEVTGFFQGLSKM